MTNEALARWNQRFSAPGYLFGTAPNRFLASQKALLKPGQRALAVADGEGRNGVWMAQQGLAVTAVDFSAVALGKARQLAEQAGVKISTIEADLGVWQWPVAAFDVVAAIFIQFAPPPMRAKMFAGMKGALVPGGLLIIEGYRPKQVEYGTGGPSQRENMYTRELLEAAFQGFEVLHLAEYDAEIEEGAGHKGQSALIDFVARKPA
ncbi:MAG: class I SAM-dependent methyltransferase [Rhodospirillaceae bacterium]|nr:class I SAM-dependent methyltransferase [Rhodospirillaceae bacterium]